MPNELFLFCFMRSKTCRLSLYTFCLASNTFRHSVILVFRWHAIWTNLSSAGGGGAADPIIGSAVFLLFFDPRANVSGHQQMPTWPTQLLHRIFLDTFASASTLLPSLVGCFRWLLENSFFLSLLLYVVCFSFSNWRRNFIELAFRMIFSPKPNNTVIKPSPKDRV